MHSRQKRVTSRLTSTALPGRARPTVSPARAPGRTARRRPPPPGRARRLEDGTAGVLAADAVVIQGKGGVVAAEAVETHGKRRCLSREGSGNARQR